MSDILEQDNTPQIIDIYIEETGDLSRIVKNFELYKGQYIDYKIDIYVPITLYPSEENHIVGVKSALMYTKPNGKISTTIGYNAILKEQGVVKFGKTYDVYEQDLPRTYVKYTGEQTLIANIYEIDNTDPTNPQFVEIITSQTCPLVVQLSDYIDNEETPDPSQLEILTAQVNELYATKQDKVDENISVSGVLENANHSVVESINALNTQVTTNTADINGTNGLKNRLSTAEEDISNIKSEQLTQNYDIGQNAGNITTLQGQVSTLEDIVGSGEDYIGTYTNTLDPETQFEALSSALTAYVETLRPSVEGGDVVIYVQQISGGTDKNYKFIYSGKQDEWTYYEIPASEKADNSTYGIVKGSYNPSDTTTKTQVDIVGGEIEDIYVRDNSNTQRHLAEYLNTDSTQVYINRNNIQTNTNNISTLDGNVTTLQGQMTGILNGTQAVGKATKADQDGNGNNIVNTYLTQTAGVTKVQMREYALPRAFNDVSYLTSAGFSNEIPTSAEPIYTATSQAVGDTTLFTAEKTLVNAEFELGSKNSSSDTIYVSASEICNVEFRLTTEVYVDNEWHNASVELTDNVQFTSANEIKKISFGGTFALLSEVLKLSDGDKFRQTLEVVTNVSSSITFNVYSNETYPSTFYLNTTSQTIQVAQGDLGEVLTLELTGTYDNVEDTVTFDIPVGFIINNSTLTQFILTLPTVTAPDELTDTTKVAFTQDTQNIITLVVPTLADNRTVPTIKDMSSAIANTLMLFKGVFEIDNGDIYLYTDITIGSDTDNLVTLDTDQTITGKKTSTQPIKFTNTNSAIYWELADNQYGDFTLARNGSTLWWFNLDGLIPNQSSSKDLGSSSHKIRDVYVGRNLTDGTNSIAIANIANKNDVLIKPLTLTTTTMTDEQIAQLRAYNCVLTNDLVLGTTSLKAGTLLTVPFEYSNSLRGIAIYNNKIMTYYINLTSKQMSDGAKDIVISQVANINTDRVTIDNYTINKDSFGQLQIGNNNATSMQFDGATVRSNNLVPIGNNSKDLGSSGQKWKDGYFAGVLSDGTNSVSIADITTLQTNVGNIQAVIPAQASSSNQLADKNFVNSSIATNTANFIGTFASVSELEAYSGTITNNDYAFVINGVVEDNGGDWATFNDLDAYDKTLLTNFDYAWVVNGSNFDLYRFDIENQEWVLRVQNTAKASVTLNTAYNRYKYNADDTEWLFEYTLNNSSFTAAQWEAINSGANPTNIAQIGTNASNITSLQTSKQDVIDSTHKLSADLVEDGSTNKVFTATEQAKLAGLKDITITTTSGSESVSDGTNTLSFGSNAFTSTTIPTQPSDIGAEPALPTTTTAGQVLKSTSTAGTVEWGTVSGGVEDVQVNGSSILNNGVANIETNTAYSASTNKIATMTDLGDKMDKANPTGTGSLSINRKSGTTVGTNSVAVGYDTTASGYYSFAEGQNTEATNYNAHASGYGSSASGQCSFAEGRETSASGNYSHAQGFGTTARRKSQHVFGEFNIADTGGSGTTTKGDYVEIVGNGSNSTNTSNARTLDWSGNEVLSGTLQTTGLKDGNNANYKLALPNTTSWTADKTIATTDQIPSTSGLLTSSDLLTYVYPVGSIYMSTSNVSPASFLGGSWSQIQGVFLLASSSAHAAGSTGGEETHVLTVNEMPSHNHYAEVSASYDSAAGSNAFSSNNYSRPRGNLPITTGNKGGDQAHNNMPPYLTVYMWQRVAVLT